VPIPAFSGGHEPHEHPLITRIWYQTPSGLKYTMTRELWSGLSWLWPDPRDQLCLVCRPVPRKRVGPDDGIQQRMP
jgi:hypothetical protein